MKFKGTIVITDPCYLDNDMPESSTSERWWDMVQYGENLEATGIEHYICESTLYGDWSCNTYKGTLNEIKQTRETWDKYYITFFTKYNDPSISAEERSKLLEEYNQYEKQFNTEYTLGSFCADAGMVCVVYLDEVLKVNPDFQKWAEEHTWCATIIRDFDGDVRYEVDENTEAHIVGTGNINFYTSQSGL
jgi:hypothetical protein